MSRRRLGHRRHLDVEALESRQLLSGTPELLKDINTQPVVVGSDPFGIDVGGALFFLANDATHTHNLWKTDGTEAGTAIVKNTRCGDLTNVNGTLFFVADDAAYGLEVWKTDGTAAGTVLVKDINPGPGGSIQDAFPSTAGHLANVNGTLFFSAYEPVDGLELWKSDGTDAGTVMVKDIQPGGGHSYPSYVTNVNGILMFRANDGTHGSELWKSDGTDAGTVLVKGIQPGSGNSSLAGLTNVNGTLFFEANDGTHGYELWKTDGTAAGTVLVKDIRAGTANSWDWPGWIATTNLTNVNGTLFFRANDGTHGYELWKSDGTDAGTVLVKDIRAGTANSWFWTGLIGSIGLTNVNGTLFFQANDGINGVELWKSNGTAAGTVMVKDISPGSAYSSPTWLTNVNGALFFAAADGTSGVELWKSNGTAAGTVRVKDIQPGSGSSGPSYLTNVGGTLFFRGNDGSSGAELWRSDGTATGTVLVKDIRVLTADSIAVDISDPFVDVAGTTFFTANDGAHGPDLWKTDGTTAGTMLVKDIRTGGVYPRYLTNVNGTLFFSTGFDDGSDRELWKSDGTAAGTVLVKDIRPGGTSYPSYLTNVNGTLYFQANDGTHGKELWKSDGTAAGTVMVKDTFPGSGGSVESLVNVNGVLFFRANDSPHGYELWKSDGTDAGTVMVKDLVPGATSSLPRYLTNVGGTLFFRASDGPHGHELWKSDGTAAGTVMVKDILPGRYSSDASQLTNVGGTLFFRADAGYGRELWKSDGTAAGTVMVKDINPGGSSSPSFLTDVSGTLFFAASDGTHGSTLWKSDGTAAGTVMVGDIYAGVGLDLTNVNGIAYFGSGGGLWKSDGTEVGTISVQNFYPGYPGNLTNVNGTLFFSADDRTHGIEPWILRPAAASTVVDQKLFYKGSTKWDVTNGATFSDDNAIAPDKTAYLPGSGTSAFSAMSSYDKGINGLMVDISGTHGAITAGDFIFKVGNNNSPSTWATAAAPTTVIVRSGAGAGGSDRVELMWADNAIQKTWLEVIVKGNDALGESNTNTGLASSYVFYFGSAIGDSGSGNSGAFQVTSADEINARNNPKGVGDPATRSDVNDFNRDVLVNSSDQIIARNHLTSLADQLRFLAVGAGGPFAPQVAAESGADATWRETDSYISTVPAAAWPPPDASAGNGDNVIVVAVSLPTPTLTTYASAATLVPAPALQSRDERAASVVPIRQVIENDGFDHSPLISHRGPITDAVDLDDELLDLLAAGRLQASLS